MPLETFHASSALSMGVELELQLVGEHDRDLASAAADLLELAQRQTFPGDIKPEMTDSMIEVATDGSVYTCMLGCGLLRTEEPALNWRTSSNDFEDRYLLHSAHGRCGRPPIFTACYSGSFGYAGLHGEMSPKRNDLDWGVGQWRRKCAHLM